MVKIVTDNKLLKDLQVWGADISGALERFMGNEELYVKFIYKFPESAEVDKIGECLNTKNYSDAVVYAHTLKGTTGNLGFTPLFTDLTKLVGDLRSEDYENIGELFDRISVNYNALYKIISENM